MSLLLFFIVLAILVLSHEFGHFIVAKAFGIRVDEFGFGFPPKLFGFKKGETEYTLNLIPFGGFVKIFGEDDGGQFEATAEEEKKRSLLGQRRIVQAAVIFAGVFFNFLLAWFLISCSLALGTPTASSSLPKRLSVSDPHLAIVQVMPDSPAGKAGLMPADKIIRLEDGDKILAENELSVEGVQNFISQSEGRRIGMRIVRGGETKDLAVVPASGIVPDKFAVGISLDNIGILKLPLYKAIPEGFIFVCNMTVNMAAGLVHFVYGFFTGESSLRSISGPVGMAGVVGDAGSLGLVYLLNIISVISINLAVLNMVPFPALDGGRILVLFAEHLKGGRISPQTVNAMNGIGFVILLLVMFVVTISDISKIIFS